jgi:hypothetical protein
MSGEITTPPTDILLQRLSSDMDPAKMQCLVYDLRGMACDDPPSEGISYLPVVHDVAYMIPAISIGKITVGLTEGKTIVLSDVLDVTWEQRRDDTIRRVAASADGSGNRRPPLTLSESEDGGEVFRHFRPLHPRARLLLHDFLTDLDELSARVDSFWGIDRRHP